MIGDPGEWKIVVIGEWRMVVNWEWRIVVIEEWRIVVIEEWRIVVIEEWSMVVVMSQWYRVCRKYPESCNFKYTMILAYSWPNIVKGF